MNEFHIPHTTTTPCQQYPEVFFHDDLDIDTGDTAWTTATAADKAARITAQENAERNAVNLCITCPLLTECRNWAATTQARIFGVVGGLVPRERSDIDTPIYVLDNERDQRGRVRIDVVHRLIRLGRTHQQIADDLACSPRTVARIASKTTTPSTEATVTALPTPRTPHKKATKAFDHTTLTPESQQIYEFLSHGNWAPREDLLTELLTIVPNDAAEKFAPANRTWNSDQARIDAGARRFLLNRLDIAIRRGRMHKRTTDDGEVLIRLDEAVALAWGHAEAS